MAEANDTSIPEQEDVEREEEHEGEDTDTEDTEDDDTDVGDDSEDEDQERDPYSNLSREEAIKSLRKANKVIKKHKLNGPPKRPVTKQPQGDDDLRASVNKLVQSDEKRQFGYEHEFSPQVVDALYRYSGGQQPDDKMLERPEVKAMVKALQSKERIERNTPRGSTGVVYKGKGTCSIRLSIVAMAKCTHQTSPPTNCNAKFA